MGSMTTSLVWRKQGLTLLALALAIYLVKQRRGWRRYIHELADAVLRRLHLRHDRDDEEEDELHEGTPPECRAIRTVEGLLAWQPPTASDGVTARSPALPAVTAATNHHRAYCTEPAPSLAFHASEGAGNFAAAPASDSSRSSCDGGSTLPSQAEASRPKLLVCHDMAGGYLQDRFSQGCGDPSSFSLWRWECVDTFVYFSHHLVTVPPPGWVAAAHRHGVKVVGTLITEWARGRARCQRLFATRASAQQAAERLAAIASHHGLDGWLVNIENGVDARLVPNVHHFLAHLRAAMRALRGRQGQVVWYDAVTVAGRLEWQNSLTRANARFLDACDGLFVNYAWRAGTPAEVAAAAGARACDVYLGVDVFGRGTYGGGQHTCDVALAAARAAGVSAALFAPGWVYENFPREGFEARSEEFWARVERAWRPRPASSIAPLSTLPLCSSVCWGRGQSGAWVQGVRVSALPWAHLAAQQLQLRLTPRAQQGGRQSLLVPAAAAGAAASEVVSAGEARASDSPAVAAYGTSGVQPGGDACGLHPGAGPGDAGAHHTGWAVEREAGHGFSGGSCVRLSGPASHLRARPFLHQLLATHIVPPPHGLTFTYAAAPLGSGSSVHAPSVGLLSGHEGCTEGGCSAVVAGGSSGDGGDITSCSLAPVLWLTYPHMPAAPRHSVDSCDSAATADVTADHASNASELHQLSQPQLLVLLPSPGSSAAVTGGRSSGGGSGSDSAGVSGEWVLHAPHSPSPPPSTAVVTAGEQAQAQGGAHARHDSHSGAAAVSTATLALSQALASCDTAGATRVVQVPCSSSSCGHGQLLGAGAQLGVAGTPGAWAWPLLPATASPAPQAAAPPAEVDWVLHSLTVPHTVLPQGSVISGVGLVCYQADRVQDGQQSDTVETSLPEAAAGAGGAGAEVGWYLGHLALSPLLPHDHPEPSAAVTGLHASSVRVTTLTPSEAAPGAPHGQQQQQQQQQEGGEGGGSSSTAGSGHQLPQASTAAAPVAAAATVTEPHPSGQQAADMEEVWAAASTGSGGAGAATAGPRTGPGGAGLHGITAQGGAEAACTAPSLQPWAQLPAAADGASSQLPAVCARVVSCDLLWHAALDAAGLPVHCAYHVWARPGEQAVAATAVAAGGASTGSGAQAAQAAGGWVWVGQAFIPRFHAQLQLAAGWAAEVTSVVLAVQPVSRSDGLVRAPVAACSCVDVQL